MPGWLRRVLHHVGTGRAVENARLDADRTAAALAAVEALAARLAARGAARDAA